MPPAKPPIPTSLPFRPHRISKPQPNPNTTLRHQHHRTFTNSAPKSATFIPRPFKTYQFTQLVTLSDGSTFTHRTTSPTPVYRSSKDVRNTPKWNPSNTRMANIEEDTTGRLSAFRARFGRGWDAESVQLEEEAALAAQEAEGESVVNREEEVDGEYGVVKEGDKGETVTVLDGVQSRVEGRPGRGGKGVARPVDEKESARSEWGDDEAQDGGNLMDLIGQFGRNEGRGGSQSGWHLGGQVRKGGKLDSGKKGKK